MGRTRTYIVAIRLRIHAGRWVVDTAIYVIAALVGGVAVYPVISTLVRSYLEFRGASIVRCPETNDFVAVEVNAGRAAVSRVFGQPNLRLSDCSRWPERRNCGQECLEQIESSPADCLVRAILAKWYAGKSCVYCGKLLGEINWLEHKPSLRSPEGQTVEWREVPAEKLPQVLATHLPVCWNCHIAARFRRLHPDLVVDRAPREQIRR